MIARKFTLNTTTPVLIATGDKGNVKIKNNQLTNSGTFVIRVGGDDLLSDIWNNCFDLYNEDEIVVYLEKNENVYAISNVAAEVAVIYNAVK